MEKILLIGGSGMLGTSFSSLLKGLVDAPSHKEIDLFNKEEVIKKIKSRNYKTVIYAAGVTNQDEAEIDKKKAIYLNFEIVKVIQKAAFDQKIPLIYFSTDAVFNGKNSSKPNSEGDEVDPVNFYGYTKALGEETVLKDSNNLVIRLISLYTHNYSKKQDFVRKIIQDSKNRKEIYGIVDLIFNPTYVDEVSKNIKKLIDKKVNGIVHVGASDYNSNFDFTYILLQKLNINIKLIPVSFNDFTKSKIAKRAQYPWLDVSKANKILNKPLLTNFESIEKLIKNIK